MSKWWKRNNPLVLGCYWNMWTEKESSTRTFVRLSGRGEGYKRVNRLSSLMHFIPLALILDFWLCSYVHQSCGILSVLGSVSFGLPVLIIRSIYLAFGLSPRHNLLDCTFTIQQLTLISLLTSQGNDDYFMYTRYIVYVLLDKVIIADPLHKR